MRASPASRTRLFPILCSTVVLTALWFGAPAVAQVTIPDPDDAVDQAGDLVKDTVKGAGDTVKSAGDTVKGAGDTVKDVAEDPVGAVNKTAGEVEEAVGNTASSTTEGGDTTATVSSQNGSGGERSGRDRDDRRRGEKSATKPGNDVAELVSGGNQISGTEVEELVSGGNEISDAEVAGTRIESGAGGGGLSLTGASLLVFLVIGAAHVGVGALLAAWARKRRRSGYGRLLEGSGH